MNANESILRTVRRNSWLFFLHYIFIGKHCGRQICSLPADSCSMQFQFVHQIQTSYCNSLWAFSSLHFSFSCFQSTQEENLINTHPLTLFTIKLPGMGHCNLNHCIFITRAVFLIFINSVFNYLDTLPLLDLLTYVICVM